MRSGISGKYRRSLAHGAAIVVAGGLLAGCSSDVMRFQDSILTGDSRAMQPAPVAQAYPGDYSQPVDTMSTGSIAPAPRRGGILQRAGIVPRPQGNVSAGGAPVYTPAAPVGQPTYNAYPAAAQQTLPPVSSNRVGSGPALAPVARAPLDNTVTGSTQPVRTPVAVQQAPVAPRPAPTQQQAAIAPQQPAAAVSTDGEGGWMRAGGTQITVKPGETVYNLSRRFGVPTDAILKANGLSSAAALTAGQQVVIPTYVHSARAPVSAPDANPNVADARSSTGTRYDVPAGRTPMPSQAPSDRVAVLPQQPAPKVDGATVLATPNPPAPASAGGGTYTVVAGDTLHGISRKTGASAEAIKQANGLSSGLIRIGQKLTIPSGGAAPVQTVAAAPKTDQTTTAAVNRPSNVYTPPKQAETAIQKAAADASAPAPNASGISKMRWPVRGRVISGFGGGGGGGANDGIDIAVPAGTAVKAAENGVVIYAGDGLKEFGNTVLVRHENGLVTVYGHAKELKVQRGQKVRRGEDIALAGMSGSADTPKLHFEVRKDSTPVDPSSYLE